jgi:hypothetical protein
VKALTLWPEWLPCITHLGKRLENRGWYPPRILVGQRIALHAGMHVGGRNSQGAFDNGAAGVERMARYAGYEVELDPPAVFRFRVLTSDADWTVVPIVRGAIVATARLAHVSNTSLSPWAVPGSVFWHLLEVRRLPDPIPCRGMQGLWDAPAALEGVS